VQRIGGKPGEKPRWLNTPSVKASNFSPEDWSTLNFLAAMFRAPLINKAYRLLSKLALRCGVESAGRVLNYDVKF
jgi:hypothetical protein